MRGTGSLARLQGPLWAAGALLAAVIGTGFAVGAGTHGAGAAARQRLPAREMTPAAVVERLREIFRAQDAALLQRDTSQLGGVFESGCPCLRSTRERVRGLRASGLVWTGYRSTIATAEPRRRSAGVWTVTALLTGSATRVMTESPEPERQLVRILPPERRRWVFHLRRAATGGPLLLTAAEPQG